MGAGPYAFRITDARGQILEDIDDPLAAARDVLDAAGRQDRSEPDPGQLNSKRWCTPRVHLLPRAKRSR